MNRKTLCALGILAAVLSAGCQPGRIEQGDARLPAEESSAAFLDRISSQPQVSQNDGLRAVTLLLDGQDKYTTFAERVEALRRRDVIADYWNMQADAPVTKGKAAYLVYQAARFPGGVTLTLTGPTERYCLRELQYQGVMPEGGWYVPVTGMEMVAVLNRADAFMQEGQDPDVLNLREE